MMASNNENSLPAAATSKAPGLPDTMVGESDKRPKESEAVVSGRVKVGMACSKKDLYQKIDGHDRITWTASIPDDLEEAAEGTATDSFALLVRNKKSSDSRRKLEIDSIIVQSPLLKNVLRDILKDYPGVTTTLSRLTFSAPFEPFIHRWDQLTEALEGEYDEATKGHLALLHTVLYGELKDVITAMEDYVKHKVVTYKHIWAIFKPGCVVYAHQLGKPLAVRFTDGQYIRHEKLGPCFQLNCTRVEWYGSRFSYDTLPHFIVPFDGTKPITDLGCFPLSYCPDEEGIRREFIARGRQFEKLAGCHYKTYSGRAIRTGRSGNSMVTVDGRIIIDGSGHRKANPDHPLYARQYGGSRITASIKSREPDDAWSVYGADYDERMPMTAGGPGSENRPRLDDDDLLICTPIVRGYDLRTKLWLEFFVDCIGEVAFNDGAFDSLVLPAGHKALILAIAEAQIGGRHAFDDVIPGKGRGVVMLLSGGPGIGKTLTAESVAEHARAPLYVMSAGDLGASAGEVEAGLGRALELAARWRAVLLLDECDAFLEARGAHDLARNQVVSVFLRRLEYHEGLLFLTTNRVADMDDAFHSRIHFRLSYPDLDARARRAVWDGFLRRAPGGHDVRAGELERLEELAINGRVIKNVLKSATLLASYKGEKLGFRHLEAVLKIDGYEI